MEVLHLRCPSTCLDLEHDSGLGAAVIAPWAIASRTAPDPPDPLDTMGTQRDTPGSPRDPPDGIPRDPPKEPKEITGNHLWKVPRAGKPRQAEPLLARS